jgi:NAD(P)-dependent dehydrogenase (short-subunit alcohol dehydrogenase family)
MNEAIRRPLEDKVALITGAAGAIGYGVCEVLLENGCTVVATDLPGERLEAFGRDLDELVPGKSMTVPLDVTDPESTRGAFDAIFEAYGRLDIVVHNAGIAHVSKIVDMDLERFRMLERVNVDGTLIVLAEAGRRLIEQGTGGDIVIMSTKNVPSPSAGFGAYSCTKAACHQLGRIASLEFAEYDIRVNMVAPDAVFSEGKYKSGLWELVGEDRMKARGISEDELHKYYRNRNLLKAAVTGRHVANAVLFFVTRQTPTTGGTIPVDGGLPDATPR